MSVQDGLPCVHPGQRVSVGVSYRAKSTRAEAGTSRTDHKQNVIRYVRYHMQMWNAGFAFGLHEKM